MRFLARGAGYSLFLTPGEAVLSLAKPQRAPAQVAGPGGLKPPAAKQSATAVLRMRMVGAKPNPVLAAAERLPGDSNYLVGSDRSRWRSGVPRYGRVRYREVYPGTDVVYYGDQGQLEYDFELAPGADPEAIGLAFKGAKRTRVDARGDLLLATAAGTVRQKKPVAYQRRDGRRQAVQSRYVVKGDRQVGLWLGAYDRSRPLVIDPVLDYSTYLGGTSLDDGRAIAVDASGSAYVTGTTFGDFPSKNALDATPNGARDVFVAKFNPTGSALEYSTYLGGTDGDAVAGIAVDGSGSAYVTGDTLSSDFPTTGNAFDRTGPVTRSEGGDAFLTKLSPAGSGLDYSTYLGGNVGVPSGTLTGFDGGSDVAVDASGAAYVAGATGAVDFPTKNAYDPVLGGNVDMFVAKLDPSKSAASSLIYSTYLGGTAGRADIAGGIAVDAAGSAYVTGFSDAEDFPTKNAFQPQKAPGACAPAGACPDAVVAKLEPDGNELVYSTFLGGTDIDTGRDIVVDPSGAAYVTGATSSEDDPSTSPPRRGYPTTPDAFQRQNARTNPDFRADADAFVTKLAASGSALDYSTYLGGGGPPGDFSVSGADFGDGIALDSCRNAYLTGSTYSSNFPMKDPVQGVHGDGGPSPQAPDVFVTKLSSAGSALGYSTYLGGKNGDYGRGIAVNPSTGTAYVTGRTTGIGSNDFPIRNAFQPTFGGGGFGGLTDDAVVAAVGAPLACGPPPLPLVSVGDVSVTEGDSGTVSATFAVSLSAGSGREVRVGFSTADDTAIPPGDYVTQAGTLTFAPGETTKTITVAVKGDTLDEEDERFFVNLLSPQNASIADGQGVGTIVDDDAPPAVSIGDRTVTEGDSGTVDATFVVSLSAPSAKAVSVGFASADDTATAPADYDARSGTLNFAPGETTKTVTVPVKGDTVVEGDERFFVNLASPVNAMVGDGQGVGTIADNDGPSGGPGLSIGDAAVTEGDTGEREATFTVSLAAASGQRVSVGFASAEDTASPPGDYASVSGTLTFDPGETSKTITVAVKGDLLDEADERFLVNLINPQNASIADGQGVGTIVDDDGPPAVSIEDRTVTEGDVGTVEETFAVSLSAPSAQPVSVDFASADDSATAPADYVSRTGTLTFNPGETTKTVSVAVKGDTLDEADERFLVNLASPQNATVADGQAVGTISDNDPAPFISIGDTTVTEGDTGEREATFTVFLSAPSSRQASVDFATADDSAAAPADYEARSGKLSFVAGEVAKTVTVPVKGDTADEPDERFLVNLTSPSSAALADGQGAGTITDDDPPAPTGGGGGGAPGGGGGGAPGGGGSRPGLRPGAPGTRCGDLTRPRSSVSKRSVLTRTRIGLTGRTTDRECSPEGQIIRTKRKLARVEVSVSTRSEKQCRFLTSKGRLTSARSCARPVWLRAQMVSFDARKAKTGWRISRAVRLPAGRYSVIVRGLDRDGNLEVKKRSSNRVKLRAR